MRVNYIVLGFAWRKLNFSWEWRTLNNDAKAVSITKPYIRKPAKIPLIKVY